MDNYDAKTDVISLTPMNNMPKDRKEIKNRGSMLLSNSYGNVPSRYLRERTGSCHDLCKYGRKHDSENNEKRLTFKKFISNSIALQAVHSLVKDPIVVDRKKKLARGSDSVKVAQKNKHLKKNEISNVLAPSPKHEINICNSQIILPENLDQHTGSLVKAIGLSDSSNIFSEALSPTHKSMEPVKEIQTQAKDDEKDRPQISAIVVDGKNTDVGLGGYLIQSIPLDEEVNHVKISYSCRNKKHVTSLMPKSTSAKCSILRQKSSASTNVDSGGDTSFFKEKRISNLKESIVFEMPKLIKQKNTAGCKQFSSPRLQSSNQNDFLSLRKTNVSAKTTTPLILRPPMNASRGLNGRTEENSNNEILKFGEIKPLKSRRAAISSTAPFHCVMSLKPRKSKFVNHSTLKKTGNFNERYGDIHEKILDVFEPKSKGKNLELNQECLSKEYDGNASESTGSEISECYLNGRTLRKHKRSSFKELEKRRTRTPAVPQSDSCSSPYKLKFKRGKVIELQAAESIGPRRLRFRRGRVFGENLSGEILKKSFRRKRDIEDSNDSNLEAHDVMLKKANLESKGVKLKHQDSQGKKNMQTLFNHVIEETANKLVEMRKSKVKALVGAFESVILLQETKQASAI